MTINWSPRHYHVFSIKWVNTVTHRVVTCLLVLNQKGFSGTAVMSDFKSKLSCKDVKSHELQHSSVKPKHSKKRCFIDACLMETSNMKKYVIGRHLPHFISRKAQLSLEEQMQRYEDLLLSAARDTGCLSLAGLLKLVIRRKWFPKCRSRRMNSNSSRTSTSG